MQLISKTDTDRLKAAVFDRLSACLSRNTPQPLAVGLSGGGDSHALLALVCDWASRNGRRVLALSVDHRLNPQSAAWTAQAGQMARAQGADWQALSWDDAALGSGLQARARMARHTLLAEAARKAGASVLLLGHTLDDAAENILMREEGTALGQLRQWSPSPVWPQGRGVTLFRPLLDRRREELRDYLTEQGLDWIDDPANENPTFARVRARSRLQGDVSAVSPHKAPLFEWSEGTGAELGLLSFSRTSLSAAPRRVLATALLCASGGSVPPRGERLEALHGRLQAGENAVAVLSGARVEMKGDAVLIMREAGEQRRQKLERQSLAAGASTVWDGRFEIRCEQADWEIMSASGYLNRLPVKHRRELSHYPAALRATLPLLHNIHTDQYVLAWSVAHVRALCGLRFRWNCRTLADETTQEAHLFHLWHGEMEPTALFSE